MSVGVLALQGDVIEHLRMVEACGAEAVEVRTPNALRGVEGLILPGGESTTIWRLLNRYGLVEPLRELVGQGLPLFATCAGIIIAAKSVVGGHPPGAGVHRYHRGAECLRTPAGELRNGADRA